jgi:hypothetical protein
MTADRSRRPGPPAARAVESSTHTGPIRNAFLIASYIAAPGHPEG